MKMEVIWTTLPNGIENGKLKLSVFVSHRLYGSDGTLKSGGFADAAEWPRKDFEFKVEFDGKAVGPIKATNELQPKVWAALMTGETPVKAYVQPTIATSRLQTLSTAHMSAMVESVYQSAVEQHPTSRIPLKVLKERLAPFAPLAEVDAVPIKPIKTIKKRGGAPTPAPPVPADQRVAALRKDLETKIVAWRSSGKPPALDAEGFKVVAFEAQRFHEPFARAVPKIDIDYHQALSALTSYPDLLRAFGLVFDLEVAVPTGLAASGVVRVVPSYTPKGSGTTDRVMATAYVFAAATGLFAAKPHAESEIVDGMLALGDDRYFVTQIDVDGAALKLMNVAAMRLPVAATDDDDDDLPSLRSAGIAINRSDRIEKFKAALIKAPKLEKEPENLHLDDLIRGYRIDVWDRGQWRSLCERTGAITIKDRPFETNWEGWISSAIASDPNDEKAGAMKLHECLCSWTGWSLAVERPGKHVGEDGTLANEPDEEHKHFSLKAKLTVPKGSLPPLRFGRKYKLRARAVDLAGNGVPLAAASSAAQETHEVVYTRFDPVLPPGLYPTAKVGFGESENHVVIRKFKGRDQVKGTRRILVPPEASESLCEQHGMFDREDGRMDPKAYGKIIAPREKADPLDRVVAGPLNDMPYLVDPMAKGLRVAYTAPEPPQGKAEPEAFGVNYPGSWPKIGSVTLTIKPVTGMDHPQPAKKDSEIEIPLRPGEVVDARVSTSTSEQHLPHLGIPNWKPVLTNKTFKAHSTKLVSLWSKEPPIARLASPVWTKGAQAPAHVEFKTAVTEGKVRLITPDKGFTLVYATQIPEQPAALDPSPPAFVRKPGGTSLDYGGPVRGITAGKQAAGTVLKTHAWSTDEVEVWATWTDELDLIEEPKRTTKKRDVKGTAFKVLIDRNSFDLPLKAKHELGDNKHHEITYTLRAHTRFRRYFDPKWDEKEFLRDSEPITFHAPSTARPADLPLQYVIPTFGWSRPTALRGGTTRSVRSGNGLRVYVSRPWFTSGNGERLAVVLPDGPVSTSDPVAKFITAFGADPIWAGGNVPRTATAAHFKGSTAAGPVSIPNVPGSKVNLATYPVQFDEDRQLWYADIQIELGSEAYTPFVKLALARYQEHSLPGLELSHVAAADFMQLEPDRAASVTWTDDKTFRASVSGMVPAQPPQGIRQGRVVIGSVEEKLAGDEDSAWIPVVVDGKELEAPLGPAALGAAPSSFTLPTDRKAKTYRLVVREYEMLPSDFREETGEVKVMTNLKGSYMGRRLVYADVIPLS